MVRLKLAFINAVILAGAVAIAIYQWPEAVSAGCFGGSGHCQGVVGTILLAVLMTGIPVLLWGAIAHFALSALLMRPGEIERYKAQQELDRLPMRKSEPPPASKPEVLD